MLQAARQAYVPKVPRVLEDVRKVGWRRGPVSPLLDARIGGLFPLTSQQTVLQGEGGTPQASPPRPLRVGVVFSGGPAAGGHTVIAAMYDALKTLHQESKLFGFLNGPAGILAGKSRELNAEEIAPFRNRGGFDLIGSGRTKIETEEQLHAALAVVQKMQLEGLVIIGGDDSNTNAAVLAEYFAKNACGAKVIGVPKTIDGDLKNTHVATSFGFDTACKTYAETIGNIACDARSAGKYYHFIKLMGRSASHIALECALATQPNLTLIGEEVAEKKQTLLQIVAEIADMICQRKERGKSYGVILVPEGLIEFIPEINLLLSELSSILLYSASSSKDAIASKLTPSARSCFLALPERIQEQLLIGRDPHGNVHVSQIETDRLLIEMVGKELEKRGVADFFGMSHFLGYEGRSGYPSNFDCNYCYALGLAAVALIHAGVSGYMAAITNLTAPPQDWGVEGVPLTSLMHLEVRKGKEKPVIRKALVDLKGKAFAAFDKARARWKLDDDYLFPGPIQFAGDGALTEQVPVTLSLEGPRVHAL